MLFLCDTDLYDQSIFVKNTDLNVKKIGGDNLIWFLDQYNVWLGSDICIRLYT